MPVQLIIVNKLYDDGVLVQTVAAKYWQQGGGEIAVETVGAS